MQAVVDAVDELWREGPGDVLVFLSGEREIHDTADALAAASTGPASRCCRCTPGSRRPSSTASSNRTPGAAWCSARTSPRRRSRCRACATWSTPASARISRYSRRLKVQRLPIEPISQASANQRAGRCGRVAPGICIRLYDEDDFAARPAFTEPEILRTNLASVILQMTAIGLGDVASFPFVEPPDRSSVRDGYLLLEELGAIEAADDGGARALTQGRPAPRPAADRSAPRSDGAGGRPPRLRRAKSW